MQQVEANADDAWKADAWQKLCDYLRSRAEFFVDDFWTATSLTPPRESRALGPLVQRAARHGYMARTGRSRPSVRSHMSDKPVWESRIYRP